MPLAARAARAARRLARRAAPAVIVAAVPLLVFGRAAGFGYVQADDTDLARDNQAFLAGPGVLRGAFERSYFEVAGRPDSNKTYYRPLVVLSLAVDARISGADPAVYHATTVLLHALVVALLFATLRAIGAAEATAAVLAIAFGVHPAAVPVACWILGRNDSLLAACVLGSLVAFERWRRRGSRPALAAHLALFAAALFAKETAIVLPPLVLLWAWLAGRDAENPYADAAPDGSDLTPPESAAGARSTGRTHGGARPNLPRHGGRPTGPDASGRRRTRGRRGLEEPAPRARSIGRRAVYGGLALGYAATAAFWLVLRARALQGGESGDEAGDVLSIAAANLPQLLVYLSTAVVPVRPSVMPGFDALHGVLGLVAGLLLVWVSVSAIEGRLALFGAAWFLAFLVPALLVPAMPAYAHRLYVPLVGLTIALSGLRAWRDPAAARRWRTRLAAMAALLAAISFVHSGVYRDRYAYWTSATRGTPYAPIAHVNLGRIDEEDGRTDRAAAHYRAALAIAPTVPGAHNNLGVLAARAGRLEEAREHFEQEIALHPANADAHFNLGLVHKLAGRLDEAAASWERAVAVDPAYAAAYDELAAHYARKGDRARAEAFAARAAALGPR
jgi:tetratricopeptide (TPR) repeat protein